MNFYAYDGTTWRDATSVYAYDGTTWRLATECWVYDGASWRQVCGASCATATCDSQGTTWADTYGASCTSCGANTCSYCMRLAWTDCDDACHQIDGQYSLSGGSFLNSNACQNKTCSNDTSCNCATSATYQFSCELTRFGSCIADTSSIQGKLIIELKSDLSDDCSILGTTKTGACVA